MSISTPSDSRAATDSPTVGPFPAADPPADSLVPPATTGRRWGAVAVVCVAAAVMGLAALLLGSADWSTGKQKAVLTHTVRRGELVVSVTEQGMLESSSNKEIKCRVKGGSTVIWVIKTGTQVKPGDVLVRLDTSAIEDKISQQRIAVATALGNKRISEAEVEVARISITEYLEGTYRSELATKQKELVIAQSNLKSAKNALAHSERLFRKGYISRLQYETQLDAVHHAELEVEVKKTDLDALQRFTKSKTLQDLQGQLEAAEARLASYAAALELEEAKLKREEEQLKNCVIRSDASGIVIYPSAAEWKAAPDIEEGAVVREDQVLLMIPDLSQMQVKIGVHESKVDRVKPGMPARVQIQDTWVSGKVDSVASVTRPTGWWNGNIVKYDTIIKLDEKHPAVKPGMSVAVEVILAKYENVITAPVAAVIEYDDGTYCWIETEEGPVRRAVQLGDTNDQFVIVEHGLQEGDRVILNPLETVDQARKGALQSNERSAKRKKQPSKKKAPSTTGTAPLKNV